MATDSGQSVDMSIYAPIKKEDQSIPQIKLREESMDYARGSHDERPTRNLSILGL